MTNKLQAILFRKDKFTTDECRKWLKHHGYFPIKRVHVTNKYYRYRLVEPNRRHNYSTINFGKNIKAILIKG